MENLFKPQFVSLPTLVEFLEYPFNKSSLQSVFGESKPSFGLESLVNPDLLDAYRTKSASKRQTDLIKSFIHSHHWLHQLSLSTTV